MLSLLPMQGFAIRHGNYERSLTQQSHLKTPRCHAQGFQLGSAVTWPWHPQAPHPEPGSTTAATSWESAQIDFICTFLASRKKKNN